MTPPLRSSHAQRRAPSAGSRPAFVIATLCALATLGTTRVAIAETIRPPDAPEDSPTGAKTGGPPFVFPEDLDPTIPAGNDLYFGMHGYFRAPMRLSWKRRDEGTTKENEGNYNLRSPWLVDDSYDRSGFAYTPVQESDFSEIYLSAGTKQVIGTVALMGSLYSDAAQPLLNRQLGIAQGFVTLHWTPAILPDVKTRVRLRAGAFWDRFGWMQRYDSYIFGRLHQTGEQVRVEAETGDFTLRALHGFGLHQESIESNQGLTLVHYARSSAAFRDVAEVGLYFVKSTTQDKRQVKDLTDASLRVLGVDARAGTGAAGKMYVAVSTVKADQSKYLSPAIEIMHSLGGEGLVSNYLGTKDSKNGTGNLLNLYFQYDYSLEAALRDLAPRMRRSIVGDGDLSLSLFGLYSYVESEQRDPDPQVNRDQRKSFKWGGEISYFPLSWVGAALRYDRVALDLRDDANSFRIVSPRLVFRSALSGPLANAQVFIQYSKYSYGERIRLRSGQIPLETEPDSKVVKIQAQIAF